MSKQTGPSMSTEPGWMAATPSVSLLLGERARQRPQNDPSMLLSFERPASAGHRAITNKVIDQRGDQPAYTPLHGP